MCNSVTGAREYTFYAFPSQHDARYKQATSTAYSRPFVTSVCRLVSWLVRVCLFVNIFRKIGLR